MASKDLWNIFLVGGYSDVLDDDSKGPKASMLHIVNFFIFYVGSSDINQSHA